MENSWEWGLRIDMRVGYTAAGHKLVEFHAFLQTEMYPTPHNHNPMKRWVDQS